MGKTGRYYINANNWFFMTPDDFEMSLLGEYPILGRIIDGDAKFRLVHPVSLKLRDGKRFQVWNCKVMGFSSSKKEIGGYRVELREKALSYYVYVYPPGYVRGDSSPWIAASVMGVDKQVATSAFDFACNILKSAEPAKIDNKAVIKEKIEEEEEKLSSSSNLFRRENRDSETVSRNEDSSYGSSDSYEYDDD